MMKINNFKRHQSGQGLPEYAFLIALVAIVAAIALGIVGLAASRLYGILGGAIGAKNSGVTVGSDFIYFDPSQLPRCGAYSGTVQLYGQLWVNSNLPLSEIQISTDQSFAISLNPNSTPNLYNIQQDFPGHNYDNSVCPHSIVVQTSKAYGGKTLFFPIEIRDWLPPS